MTHARCLARGRQRRKVEPVRTEQRQRRGGIPPDELGVEGGAVGPTDAKTFLAPQRARCRENDVVLEDHAARGPAMPLDLDNGRAGRRHGVGHLVGELRQHTAMVAERRQPRITRTGRDTVRGILIPTGHRGTEA